jgi:hypothetical protein
MPRTKRPKPLYQRGPFKLYPREGRNHEIVWYDEQRGRERSASTGTADDDDARLELDRHYLSTQGVKHCRTCGQVLVGEHAPLVADVIADYLVTMEGKAGEKSARGRLAHVVAYLADTDAEITVPQVTEEWIERFRKWLLKRPVLSPKGRKLRERSIGAVEGSVMQLAAAINKLPNHKALFRARSLKDVAASPRYRADIETIAAMFRFALAREDRHTLRAYLRGAVATWARPDALLELTDRQWIAGAGVLDLSPPGRHQTKKRRPIIPIARQFRPYLDALKGQYLPVVTLRHAWDPMRRALGLPGEREAGAKLIRRSIATIARRKLGEERWVQGQMMLGHVKAEISDIYAIPDPANLGAALAVTEQIIDEIESLAPGAFTAGLPQNGVAKPALKVVENG